MLLRSMSPGSLYDVLDTNLQGKVQLVSLDTELLLKVDPCGFSHKGKTKQRCRNMYL